MRAEQDIAIAAGPGRTRLCRWAPLALVALAAVLVLGSEWRAALSLETLVRHRMAIEAFLSEHLLAGLAIYALLYIGVVALSVPGAVWLTISGGLLFGAVIGAATTVVCATIGATIIFRLAQSAVGETLLRRAGPRAARLGEGFRLDAFNYLLFLRLVPAFPFFLVNLAAALVAVPLRTFVAATAIGIIPATVAFSLAGAGLDSVIAAQAASYQACLIGGGSECRIDFGPAQILTPQMLAALAALGLLALLPVAVRRWRGRRRMPLVPQ